MNEDDVFYVNTTEDKRICIKKNEMNTGCSITAANLYETFTCENCEHKGKWNCISLKLNDVLTTRK